MKPTHRCSKCGPKPIEEFWINYFGKPDSNCKRCRAAHEKHRHHAHRDEINTRRRERYTRRQNGDLSVLEM